MAHITITDGLRLYIEEAGSGDPIVFVHEFAGDHLSWAPPVHYFSRRYRCITFAARFRDAVGPLGGLLMAGLDRGGPNAKWERESMHLLAQNVMPKFRQHTTAQAAQ